MARRPSKKRFVERLVERLKAPLRMTDWTFTVEARRISKEEGSAGCVAKPPYKEAALYFDLRKIPTKDIPAYVVHEMLHVPVWKLAEVGEQLAKGDVKDLKHVNDEEEALTTEFEKILMPLLEPYIKDIVDELFAAFP